MKHEMKYLLAIAAVFVAVASVFIWQNYDLPSEVVSSEGIKKFSSESELIEFLENAESYDSDYGYRAAVSSVAGAEVALPAALPSAEDSFASGLKDSAEEYSTTNIQVEGVDEPDIVKNDGKYIYVVSGKKIVIIEAYPVEEMETLSEIDFEDYVRNIFLYENKLVVLIDHYEYLSGGVECYSYGLIRAPCGRSIQEGRIKIYDVSDGKNPEFEKEFSFSGNLVEARLVDGIVYVVNSKYVSLNDFEMPYYSIDGVESKFAAEDVFYFGEQDGGYVFNVFGAIDVESGEMNSEAYLLGSSHTIYVSEGNIYLTAQKSIEPEERIEGYAEEVVIPSLPRAEAGEVREILESDEKNYIKSREIGEVVSDYAESLRGSERIEFLEKFSELSGVYYEKLYDEMDRTVIHKISFDGLDFEYEANGEVPGTVLNQFSMDEFDGNFRIATTSRGFLSRADGSVNNVYVLDENLEIVGRVEDLAKGERIYSTRFIGERVYMVTFRQVDPLYVIDLSNPEEPEVLGFLKVTGYSSYLHPYDENHLIGVGMEADESGRVRGVKISLFDVSDVSSPKEVGKYEVREGQWSYSDALYDHKAFLFDREKELLVVPVSYSTQSEYWQGAYVLNVDLEGINLKGKVAHERAEEVDYWYRGNDYVRRALYIDDVLYTISSESVKASALSDLSEIKSVDLPHENYYVPYAGGVAVKEDATVASAVD